MLVLLEARDYTRRVKCGRFKGKQHMTARMHADCEFFKGSSLKSEA